jgi:C4-dicarboxylate transporter DctM subunit
MDIPALRNAGYRPEYAVSVVAASSAMGVLIPPCIIMVVLGALMNVSVAALFVAGFLPALVLALGLFGLIAYQARRYRFPREEQRLSFREVCRTFLDSAFAIGMFVLIFGGILSGAMTPTEAGAVAVVYALVVGMAVYREVSLARLWTLVRESAAQSAMVLFILGVANVFSFILSTQKVPQTMVGVITGLSDSAWFFLIASLLVLIALASVIEPLPAIIIFIPIFLPVLDRLGIDRLHYGVLVTAATGLAMFLPPIGAGLILVCAIGRVGVSDVLRYLAPFLLMLSLGLLVLVFVPKITTLLPELVLPRLRR